MKKVLVAAILLVALAGIVQADDCKRSCMVTSGEKDAALRDDLRSSLQQCSMEKLSDLGQCSENSGLSRLLCKRAVYVDSGECEAQIRQMFRDEMASLREDNAQCLFWCTPGNVLAVPGGPYEIAYGSSLSLDASGSNGQIIIFMWDLNNDGLFDFASSNQATLEWSMVMSLVCGGECIPDKEYTIQLRVSDGRGQDTKQTLVTFDLPLMVTAGGPYEVSYGNALTLDGSSSGPFITSYSWSINGQTLISSDPSITLLWSGIEAQVCAGACQDSSTHGVMLTVTDKFGRTASSSSSVLITVPLVPSAGGPYEVQEGSSVTLDAGSSYPYITAYQWEFPNGMCSSDQPALLGSWDEIVKNFCDRTCSSGTVPFTLMVTDQFGRTASVESSLSIIIPFLAVPGGPYEASFGNDLIFDASGSFNAAVYEWTFPNGTRTSNDPQFSLSWADIEFLICGGPCADETVKEITLTIDDGVGSQMSAGTTLSIKAPLIAHAGGPYQLIAGNTLALDASSSTPYITEYTWLFPNGNVSLVGPVTMIEWNETAALLCAGGCTQNATIPLGLIVTNIFDQSAMGAATIDLIVN